jgi:hypothetical protein
VQDRAQASPPSLSGAKFDRRLLRVSRSTLALRLAFGLKTGSDGLAGAVMLERPEKPPFEARRTA